MFWRTKLVTVGLISLFMPLWAAACWVCDTPPTPKHAVQRYPVVFIGTVESRTSETVRFSVQEVFGGEVQREVVMNQSGYSCDFRFEKGKTYLVYTTPDEKGLLAPARMCSRTSEISGADADLKYLRSITSGSEPSNETNVSRR